MKRCKASSRGGWLGSRLVVEEPSITTPERNGFVAVEWGGMVKMHPDSNFTCSQ